MDWQPGQPPMMGGHRIAERVAELERQLAELKKAVAVSPGRVVIQSPGTINIEAAGTMDLSASLLRLPGGARPIVRVGDNAVGAMGPVPITGPGNPLVLG